MRFTYCENGAHESCGGPGPVHIEGMGLVRCDCGCHENQAHTNGNCPAPVLLARVERLEAALRWFTTRTSHEQSERETYKVAAAFINIARAALAGEEEK